MVRLTPRGGRDAIDGWEGDVLRARVAAAPADGRANASLLRLLARSLGLPPSALTLAAGASSRTKLVDVDGLPLDEVRARVIQGRR
jgi:uncharacterized protein YggU (UPF0235/DUF167 family)